ncbi:YceI family protein [Cognatitamlana onchidii]|uniref:YceI family protein n=1 Tax=Cognatitamlana onchidii TaxID=2562860 RepID=UPI0010A66F24|nr:YceI family protein [Algibacter onchidii]
MTKNIATLLFTCFITLGLSGCKNNAKEATTNEAEIIETTKKEIKADVYNANTAASIIEWKGSKPTGSHHGTISIKNGALEINDDRIVGGAFNIDMHSIIVKDIPVEDEKNGKLLGHLKSPDFFNVNEHPSATFIITGSQVMEGKTMLSGNLKIKEIENNITFPAVVNVSDNETTLTSDSFSIDRSKWDIKYGSKSFFDNLGDKFINNDIELKIAVIATKP